MVTELRALEPPDMLIPHLFYHLVDYELKFVQVVSDVFFLLLELFLISVCELVRVAFL